MREFNFILLEGVTFVVGYFLVDCLNNFVTCGDANTCTWRCTKATASNPFTVVALLFVKCAVVKESELFYRVPIIFFQPNQKVTQVVIK